jgi:hypothetical protein
MARRKSVPVRPHKRSAPDNKPGPKIVPVKPHKRSKPS